MTTTTTTTNAITVTHATDGHHGLSCWAVEVDGQRRVTHYYRHPSDGRVAERLAREDAEIMARRARETAPCAACGQEAWDTTTRPAVLDPENVTGPILASYRVRATVDETRKLLVPVARRVLRAGVKVCDVCVLGIAHV